MKNRKAQVEIVGIAIVLVIVILGALFLFGMSTKTSNGPTVKQELKKSKLGPNFLNAMLKTTTPCNSYSVKELFNDCFTKRLITCSSQTSSRTKTYNSCNYLTDVVLVGIFNFLDEEGEYYDFKVYLDGEAQGDFEKKSKLSNKLCAGTKKSVIYLTTTDHDSLKLELTLCT